MTALDANRPARKAAGRGNRAPSRSPVTVAADPRADVDSGVTKRGVSTPAPYERSALGCAMHTRAMRRLGSCIRTLVAILLALSARAVLDGLSIALGITTALLLLLLLASISLWRAGKRLGEARRLDPPTR